MRGDMSSQLVYHGLVATITILTVCGPAAPPGAASSQSNASLMDLGSSEVYLSEQSLEGIWRLQFGNENASMAIYQHQDQLFGAAGSEEGGWNSAVLGTATGSDVDLTLTYLHNGRPVTMRLIGRYENGNITGTFLRVINGKPQRGAFTALLIYPDPSSYAPATEKAATEKLSFSSPPAALQDLSGQDRDQPSMDVSAIPMENKSAASRFIDVHSLAHLVPPAAGVIPPGINMGGGGGMGMS